MYVTMGTMPKAITFSLFVYVSLSAVLITFFLASMTSATMTEMIQHKIKTEIIDVRPGAGRQEVEQKWGEFTCKFEYKSQGGTNEQWSMTMARNKKGTEWLCVVERPSGLSYLFFEEFKLLVAGSDLHLQETLLEKKDGVPLRNDEYIVVKDDNYVMQWDNKFDSQLTKVQIYATSKKRLKTKSDEL